MIKRRALVGSTVALASAQQVGKSIRPVVPYPPGGGADILAQLKAQGMSTRLGLRAVVENKGGANGQLAGDIAPKSETNGKTRLAVMPGVPTRACRFRILTRALGGVWLARLVCPRRLPRRLPPPQRPQARCLTSMPSCSPASSTSEEFSRWLSAELVKYGNLVNRANTEAN